MPRLPKLRPAGWAATLARWLARSPIDNRWLIGRLVEIGGNHVTVDGLTFALDNPLIRTREKSTVCLGLHEAPEVALVRTRLMAGLPVIELGGGIGIVSCNINRRLAHPRDHIVVEANLDLIPALETNRRLNRCEYQIRSAALAYGDPTTVLSIDSWVTSRVGGRGTRRAVVATTTLAQLLRQSGFAQINLVVDIEGAEADLVEQEGTLLRERVRTLILETHPSVIGAERAAQIIVAIRSLGFAETARFRHVWAFHNTALAPGWPSFPT
jgi:FkbM family methyltransferase